MGSILLERDRRPRAEYINDVSGNGATFFRVLQEHHLYVPEVLRFRVASRAEFERLSAEPADRPATREGFVYPKRLGFGRNGGGG